MAAWNAASLALRVWPSGLALFGNPFSAEAYSRIRCSSTRIRALCASTKAVR